MKRLWKTQVIYQFIIFLRVLIWLIILSWCSKGVRSWTTNPISKYVSCIGYPFSFIAFTANVSSGEPIPNTILEALTVPKWEEVIYDETRTLKNNNTFVLIDLSLGKRPVRCKWKFTLKHKECRTVERYKTWLRAKGLTET